MAGKDALDVLDAEVRSRLPASRPGWQAPMLATLTEHYFSDPDWLYERKLDGMRALAVRDEQPHLWSRNQKSLDASYPELVDALAANGPDRFVADGEIVAFEGNQTSFAKLQARIHVTGADSIRRANVPVFYYLFDLLSYNGFDLTARPLSERKRVLRSAFRFTDPLRFSAHRNTDGVAFYQQACANGWEGLIAKRGSAPYRHGRSTDWLKFKCVKDQEFVVGGFTEPSGSRSSFGALLVGYYAQDRLCYAGKVGTGYNEKTLRTLRRRMDQLEQPGSPFAEPVHQPRVHWVRPELVAQIGFTEWTRDGKLRHPRFTGLRDDKSARDVVREAP